MSGGHDDPTPTSPKSFAVVGAIALGLMLLLGILGDKSSGSPQLFEQPVEYYLFAATLIGIAFQHLYALQIAICGSLSVLVFKLMYVSQFSVGAHLSHEWVLMVNLFGLLVGFGLLADHFESSGIPERLPRILPGGWKGNFALLLLVFVMSAFLDNIAAAMIGGGVAATIFRGKVHVAYLAGIVACSNAGGAGSVLGDTTTTMMWLEGVAPLTVIPAFIGALIPMVICGIPAALIQDSYQQLDRNVKAEVPVDAGRLVVVFFILAAVVAANVLQNTVYAEMKLEEHFPLLAAAVWGVLLLFAAYRMPNWKVVPSISRGSLFLVALVLCASMMPLEQLPDPTWKSTMAIGAISSVFDNIPLTALALKQGGYDWALLAYAVGFGGSIMWFGSSAGVALSSRFPAARSTAQWLKYGFTIPIAYVIGYLLMLKVVGWHPAPGHHESDGDGHGTELHEDAHETGQVHAVPQVLEGELLLAGDQPR